MFRFLTLTALSVMTSGCLIGAVSLVPAGNPVQNPGRFTQEPADSGSASNGNLTSGSTPLPNNAANTASPTSAAQVILGRWEQDSGSGIGLLFRPDKTVTAASGDDQVLGTYTVTEQTVTVNFPGEGAVTHQLSFRNGGNTMQLGSLSYSRR